MSSSVSRAHSQTNDTLSAMASFQGTRVANPHMHLKCRNVFWRAWKQNKDNTMASWAIITKGQFSVKPEHCAAKIWQWHSTLSLFFCCYKMTILFLVNFFLPDWQNYRLTLLWNSMMYHVNSASLISLDWQPVPA